MNRDAESARARSEGEVRVARLAVGQRRPELDERLAGVQIDERGEWRPERDRRAAPGRPARVHVGDAEIMAQQHEPSLQRVERTLHRDAERACLS